ncbi:Phosphatidylglycerol/phosphatidylinositol transfer protein [Pleurotus pulmonarius]|nr:Phosphatidylglycerol/phosphatidylinositol transfer protein [Pleurotus pulmonarius]KAF4605290.1 Phosphatidylglycerol/phosphatidylinositol transfer protein [Pleurotus pulmonarius]KAF4606779.1 Phosphatidylglycerol/phosphatidylinositol transfer protein [Pleurotus pulmonarius]
MTRYAFSFLLATLAVLSRASPLDSTQTALTGGDTVHTTDDWGYTDCGLPTDPIQITSIVVTPDPPQPGKNMTVKVKATAIERVEEGAYADVIVKLGLIKLLHKQFDLCEEARNADTDVQCPVEPGDYEVEQTVELPKEIPKAKFVVNVRGYTADDEDLVCLDLKVNFMKRPFLKSLGF